MGAFVLAGTNSGVGKTSISMALMAAFEDVSPFKVGPDYIDPGFHRFITGNPSYNLDLFFMEEEGVRYSFQKHHKKMSIVEGVMGLYDGIDNSLDNYSTAHLARVLDLPVILVLDASGKSTSIAAQVLGYQKLDERVKISGVIINKVASEKSYQILKEAIEKYSSLPCLGYFPKKEDLMIESRHLGLLQANEVENLKEKMEILVAYAKQYLDLEKIQEIAKDGERSLQKKYEEPKAFTGKQGKYQGKKIALAKDEVFSFYYEDNLEYFSHLGFELVHFSPLHDEQAPDCDFYYFGGGYPENFVERLAGNQSMLESLRKKIEEGKVFLGECGGFMYLAESLESLEGKSYELLGAIPAKTYMTKRLDISRFGYIRLENKEGKELGRAHEFHYSKLKDGNEEFKKYKAVKKDGRTWPCIFQRKGVYGGYPHLHFFSAYPLLEEILKTLDEEEI